MAKSGDLSKERLSGIAIPVGALRGSQSSGVGEYLDLIDFADLCVDMGIGLIQLLPVNDTGYDSSPYSALTAFALHPLYIRLNAIEESEEFSGEITELGKTFDGETRFPYYKILCAKMELLRKIYNANKAAIEKDAVSGDLSAWIKENPWVKAYAVYRNLKEKNNEKSWKDWEQCRNPNAEEINALWEDPNLAEKHLFWTWLQKALDKQFAKAAQAVRSKGILLKGDIPILMNEDSCDVWNNPNIFCSDLSAGAPPDMYSPVGQNWGFPIYNWEAQAKDDYSWWKARLKAAEKYYDAYRIDHVLGFFRIWASSRLDNTSVLGRFVPFVPITNKDLEKLEFDKDRIKWLSKPHINTEEVTVEAQEVFERALTRIGSEELWLFKDTINGEKDICSLGLGYEAEQMLIKAWHNRFFYEYEDGKFFPVWYGHDSKAYVSLSEKERIALDTLCREHSIESEKIWEKEGLKLLSVLIQSSAMLPCAEDLGAVPACVPKVLSQLQILGLRVIRWFRYWDQAEQPFVPFEDYPELSVCTASVHDSSTLREWWNSEADQTYFASFIGMPSLPKVYNPGTAKIILKHAAAAASRFRIFQIQDILHLSKKWYAKDPASERINVPGTSNEFNWTYRLPAPISEIAKDSELIHGIRELTEH